MKILITYISNRGMYPHVNLFPETVVMLWPNIGDAPTLLGLKGFWVSGDCRRTSPHHNVECSTWISPAAILSIAPYRHDTFDPKS